MKFNKHSDVEGKHAFLSASKFHWLRYDDQKLMAMYNAYLAVQKGTAIHDLARRLIELGQRLPKTQKTLNLYVNDAIGYKMTPEQPLYFSENCFGTADAVAFKNRMLRIHDLKTGTTPAHMEQLYIYAALFCLEYKAKPEDMDMELRIYQNDEIVTCTPSAEEISQVMEKIISFDQIIRNVKRQEG